MIEKVNPSHPDKLADRIAGALVDLAYIKNNNPKAKQLLNIFLGAFLSSGLWAILTRVITKLHIASKGPIIWIKLIKAFATFKNTPNTALLQDTKYNIRTPPI